MHLEITLMALLAIQFAAQPVLQTHLRHVQFMFIPILLQEVVKGLLCLGSIVISSSVRKEVILLFSDKKRRNDFIKESIRTALLPALLYSIQNWLSNFSSRYLDGLSWHIVNQLKTLSAAFFSWIILGRKQTSEQLFALLLLFVAACLLVTAQEIPESEKKFEEHPAYIRIIYGIIPLFVATLISGFCAVLSEIALKTRPSTFVYSLELSLYGISSILLSVFVGIIPGIDIFSLINDQEERKKLWIGWTNMCWVPIFTNSVGGLLVGAVTKYAGSIRKGFALIAGICLSAVIQSMVDINIQGAKKQPLLINHWIAAVLTVAGMYIHLQPSKFSSFLFGKAKQDTPIESSSSTGSQEKISKDIGKEKTQ